MSYTKGELVSAAFEEIGIAEYEFDISPEQVESGIRRLDMMMATWASKKISLSFPISKLENSYPSDDSNIPDWAWEAVVTNLAIRIAPSFGKSVSPDTKVIAKESYNAMLAKFSKPREIQFSSMPKGAGYKTTDQRFTPDPEEIYLKDVDESFDPSGGPL